MCLETAGNVQLHSAIAPHLESSEVKSEEIKHHEGKQEEKKKKKSSLASYDMGN